MADPKKYLVNEIFYSLQGEATWAGTPSVFVRFSKCNLACPWCDTNFKDATPMTSEEIMVKVDSLVPEGPMRCNLVFTGGEPSLQLDEELVSLANERGYYTCVETNGTKDISHLPLDWITLSPKAPFDLKQRHAHEVKLVSCYMDQIPNLQATIDSANWYLQPLADPVAGWVAEEVQRCVGWVLANPTWRLSLQLHKALGLR